MLTREGSSYGATCSECVSLAEIKVTSDKSGCLVGAPGGVIQNCYATGNVTSTGNGTIGGLGGGSDGGGIQKGVITNSYSIGKVVSSHTKASGLVGPHSYNSSVTVTNSFWDTQTSQKSNSYGGTGKTTQEMQTASTFINAGWSTNIWNIKDGFYPTLKWESLIQ